MWQRSVRVHLFLLAVDMLCHPGDGLGSKGEHIRRVRSHIAPCFLSAGMTMNVLSSRNVRKIQRCNGVRFGAVVIGVKSGFSWLQKELMRARISSGMRPGSGHHLEEIHSCEGLKLERESAKNVFTYTSLRNRVVVSAWAVGAQLYRGRTQYLRPRPSKDRYPAGGSLKTHRL